MGLLFSRLDGHPWQLTQLIDCMDEVIQVILNCKEVQSGCRHEPNGIPRNIERLEATKRGVVNHSMGWDYGESRRMHCSTGLDLTCVWLERDGTRYLMNGNLFL